jgi:hypothetical protein
VTLTDHRLVSIINRLAGSRQFAKFASKNYFQKSSLKRDGPVFFQIEAARIGIKMKKITLIFGLGQVLI